jgi:hypothetical protein
VTARKVPTTGNANYLTLRDRRRVMLVDDIRKGITMRLSVVGSVEEIIGFYDLEPPLKVATTRDTLQALFTH